MNRHRNGQFAARPVRDAVPLCIATTKSARVTKGNLTRAREQKTKVFAVAAVLSAATPSDPFAAFIEGFV